MTLAASVIRGPYFQDLLEQPDALARTAEGLDPDRALLALVDGARARAFTRVVLTGMGSSLHALHPLQQRLARHAFTPLLVDTSELVGALAPLLTPETLLVAVSQSGRSAEVLRLIDRAGGRAPLLAVTNDAAAPLGAGADATVVLRAGPEASVSCKTYLCTLAALEWVGALLCGVDPEACRRRLCGAVEPVRAYLRAWPEHVAALDVVTRDLRQLFFGARGPSLAAAGTAGLIMKEAARFPTEAMGAAAFRHGPLEMVDGGVLLALFEGDGEDARLNARLADDVRTAGGRAELIGRSARCRPLATPEMDPSLRPLFEILPAQMLSLTLAARQGREAGRFERATKVTTIE